MSLTNAYLTTTKNLPAYFNAMVSAEAPERFTARFLEQLGFTSSYDRLFPTVLKGLKFLDDNGAPIQRYFDFLDQTQSGVVMAQAIREAYEDLFNVNKKAYELSLDDVRNKLKTITQGKKSERVIGLMAGTFKKLSELADWTDLKTNVVSKTQAAKSCEAEPETLVVELPAPKKVEEKLKPHVPALGLNYNIQIHLPESRDPAVFDAIFRSLRDHLL